MATIRLPQPGADEGEWGTILNDYLSVSLAADGTIKPAAVQAQTIKNDAITAAHVADAALPQAKISGLAANFDLKADKSTVYTKSESDAAINGFYTLPAEGIAKSDLEAAVQASLAKADTALQSVPPATANTTQSGFPLRRAGERNVSISQELANAFAQTTNPQVPKRIVLAESWDTPGILKHIWIASNNTASRQGFMEEKGTIAIFIDSDTAPAVSMTIADFFYMANHSDVFATPRIGRTSRIGDQSSAYRYLHMPFQKYLRVEIINETTSDTVFYGTADYTLLNSFADVGSQQRSYSLKGTRVGTHPVLTPLTICDLDGAGQVESLYVSFSAATGNDGIMEGNVEIYIDGEASPSWMSSGMEDAFNGGWYATPIGGYPAGRAGAALEDTSNRSYYRFFLDDPIFFSSHIKVVVWAGQPGQGTVSASTIVFAGYAGLWFDTVIAPNYLSPDAAQPLLDDNFSYSGSLPSGSWNQAGDRTQAQGTGSSIVIPYGNAGPDEDVRLARKGVTLPANYWVETRVRITDATHDNQQVHLIMLGVGDPYFGSAVHVQLFKHSATSWSINVRDDFDTAFVTQVGSGRDLTNKWVRLAFKKAGNTVTAYYSMNDAASYWAPLGSWQATKSDTTFGIGTWTAGAEFSYLKVLPLI